MIARFLNHQQHFIHPFPAFVCLQVNKYDIFYQLEPLPSETNKATLVGGFNPIWHILVNLDPFFKVEVNINVFETTALEQNHNWIRTCFRPRNHWNLSKPRVPASEDDGTICLHGDVPPPSNHMIQRLIDRYPQPMFLVATATGRGKHPYNVCINVVFSIEKTPQVIDDWKIKGV